MARFSLTLLAVLTAGLLLVPSAGAAEPLTIRSTVPADGAFVLPTPFNGIAFAALLTGVPDDAQVSVTVSTSTAADADGALLTASRVDFFFLFPNGVPGGYSALSDPGPNAWSGNLGPYFWQIVATWTDAAGVFHDAVGKIEALTIGTQPATPVPAPLPPGPAARPTLRMTTLDAPYYVRTLIRRHTHRAPVSLRTGCRRLNTRSFRCRPTWRDSRNSYSATLTLTHGGTLARVTARATATGRRASRRCTRRRTFKACATAFRWQSTMLARPLGPTR
jgi:hypothetical protein